MQAAVISAITVGIIVVGFMLCAVFIYFIAEVYAKRKVKVKIRKQFFADETTIEIMRKQIGTLKLERDGLIQNKSSLESENNCLEFAIEESKKHLTKLNSSIEERQKSLDFWNTSLVEKHQEFQSLCDNINDQAKIEKDMEETSRRAFQSYCEILEKDYEKKDKEYEEKLAQCKLEFNAQKEKMAAAREKEQEELEKIRNMRKAIQEAQRLEQSIKEKEDFFKIKISDDDIADVLLFEEFKTKVKNKRAVSMLIWSTWYQKPMTALCNKLLGTAPKCGIYRITNQKTDQCYIGQAVNIADRWKQHAKCGLGIDTPAGNKLYKAMQEYGLQSFTWELLEECPKDKLNEKERNYIDFYMSKDYGYNSNIGVK